MMMKRWLPLALICMLLTGCGGKKNDPPADPPAPPPVEVPAESGDLDAFREEIGDERAVLAAAYLGYAELTGYEDLTVYLEANGFCQRYPFLSELTEKQFVQQEGGELYLVVPVSGDTALTVYDCAVDESAYELARGEAILTLAPGEPAVLQGNVSEVVSNLWVEADTFAYSPYLNLMDGSLAAADGVWDCSDYDLLARLWGGWEVPVFCGTWYAQALDGDGHTRAMKLSLWEDGSAEYSYGIPESDLLEFFEGYWHEDGGTLTMELHGGPVGDDGNALSKFAYDSVCTFEWDYQSRHLYLSHTDGDVLLYGTEGETFDFLPFDAHLLAGMWSAEALYRDWTYDLSLLENGECLFAIFEGDEELALYEGWWSATEDGYVSLDLGLQSGRHPESPELEYISGVYLAEKHGSSVSFSFVSGEILTLNMEENGYETFTTEATLCISVHYAKELGISWDDYDWIIVDDTEPIEAVFGTMVPVENFKVVSLFLQENDSAVKFEATELFDYGTLTPEMPLCVVLTDYGTIPSYGISFTDPSSGAERLFGVSVSGIDGSLELVDLG